MSKFTYYPQHDQMDCGPACLRMVARHHGRHFSAQYVRERTELSKEGVSLLGIAEAAEAIGFRTLGVQVPFEKLMREAPLPCIVHWQQNHFIVVYDIQPARGWLRGVWGGFRPATARAGEVAAPPIRYGPAGTEPLFAPAAKLVALPPATVYVADPGRGLLTLSAEEFCTGWLSDYTSGQRTGVAILLEPTPALFEHQEDDDPATAGAGRYGFGRVLSYLLLHRALLAQLLLRSCWTWTDR